MKFSKAISTISDRSLFLSSSSSSPFFPRNIYFSFHKTVLVFVLLLECLIIHDNIRVGELAEFFRCVH